MNSPLLEHIASPRLTYTLLEKIRVGNSLFRSSLFCSLLFRSCGSFKKSDGSELLLARFTYCKERRERFAVVALHYRAKEQQTEERKSDLLFLRVIRSIYELALKRKL